jgi:hypothetical protein
VNKAAPIHIETRNTFDITSTFDCFNLYVLHDFVLARAVSSRGAWHVNHPAALPE